jgi:lysophospholipase L1-like esterase
MFSRLARYSEILAMANDAAANAVATTRREFVLASAGLSAAAVAGLVAVDDLFADEKSPLARPQKSLLESGQTILFQGDSITDAGRDRNVAGEVNSYKALGNGYAWLAATQLLVSAPDAGYKIFNRGISGVNDYWHNKKHDYDGTVEKYETDYRELVKRTKGALPKLRLVICEPFLLECGVVTPDWPAEFASYREAAQRVATEAGATFVPFQKMFDIAAKVGPPEVWARDGVHPSSSGAALMAHAWLTAVGA